MEKFRLSNKYASYINLADPKATIYQRPFKIDREKKDALHKWLELAETLGLVEQCDSRHNNNLTFVKKR